MTGGSNVGFMTRRAQPQFGILAVLYRFRLGYPSTEGRARKQNWKLVKSCDLETSKKAYSQAQDGFRPGGRSPEIGKRTTAYP